MPLLRRSLILFLLLTLAGCSEPPAPMQRLPTDAVVLAFGDSLTFGTGVSPEQSYPSVLAGLTGLTVVNAGVPGEISADGLRRLPHLLEKHQPALVILTHGGNDLLRRKSKQATEQNLRAMLALIRQSGAQVLLVGVPAPGLLLSAVDLYPRVAEDLALPYEGDVLPEVLSSNQTKSDTVHPNAKGYRMMAEAFYRLLREGGAL